MNNIRHVALELIYHAPFTALGTALGLALIAIFTALAPPLEAFEDAFHTLHPIHMFLSAIATAAVYHRHRPKVQETLIVGLVGAVAICSLSDIVLPYVGGLLLGMEGLKLHICLLEHPWIALTPALIGCFTGMKLASHFKDPSLIPHGGHVMISVLASLSYLAAFSSPVALISTYAVQAFIVVFLAVLIPCCTSDIVFPIMALPSHPEAFEAHRCILISLCRAKRREGKQ